MTTSEFDSRVEKASEILKVKPEEIFSALENIGISKDDFGFQLLEANTTTQGTISEALEIGGIGTSKGIARFQAAISILKGWDPFAKTEQAAATQTVVNNNATGLEQLFKVNRPLANWKDRELLEEFLRDEDLSVQQELDKRAGGRPFIVLDQNEKVQLELSLDLLKRARKGEDIPDMIPVGPDRANVYPIQSFKRDNRIKDESPLIPGAILLNGYCKDTDENFSEISQEARQFMRLVVDFTGTEGYKKSKFHSFRLDSFSDRKALVASASKGLEDLKRTWPSVARLYDDKKAAGTLPSLKIVVPIAKKSGDPFFPGQHKEY